MPYPNRKNKTSFVKNDPRLIGIKQSIEHIEKRSKLLRKQIEINCDYCGEKLVRNPYQIKNNKYHFCNRICWGKWASSKRTELCGYNLTSDGKKIIIEVFGNYWHNIEDVKIKDEKKKKILEKYGWKRIIFWESEIKNSEKTDIIKSIKEQEVYYS